MPIGLVSDEDVLKELSQNGSRRAPRAPKDSVVEVIPRPGRKEGDVNVPESLRKVIAEDALLNGRESALELARGFGISASSVSAYTKGATSTKSYNSPSESLIGHINQSRQRAVKRASKTLNQALGSITQEKLDYADVKDLSGIAKDMSVIIKNLEPQKEVESGDKGQATPQFVIYAPQFKKEEFFDVIQVVE
jgi:hypothetical protein